MIEVGSIRYLSCFESVHAHQTIYSNGNLTVYGVGILWRQLYISKPDFGRYSLHSPVQAPILNRFRDMTGLNFFRPRKIRDRAADFEHTAVSPGAEAKAVDCILQELFSIVFKDAMALYVSGAHLRVAVNISFVKAL